MLGMVGASGTFSAGRLFRHPWTVSHLHDNPSIWTVIFPGPPGWNASSLHDRPGEGNLWPHCRTTTSRKSPPSIWFCVCEVACRSLWGPWLAKPSLWKWSPQTLLKMWRPRFRIKKAFPRPAVSYLCWQAAGGWPHSVWLQHPEGVHSPLGAASPWWLLTFICFSFMLTHFFSNTDYFCALL